jgi:FHA domain
VGLAAGLLVPVRAIAGFVINRHLLFSNGARLPEPIADIETRWPRDAWITIEGSAAERREISCEMLNIGRDDDNDLQLEHASVHRHHAVLHRSSNALIYVRDLSGDKGNGVKVNGERVRHVALTDGDRVEVGAFAFKFEAHPM